MGPLALTLFLLAGLAVGTLGGGGSILSVPILLEVVQLKPREAIATSLVVVAATSALAAALHARQGNIDWQAALRFGLSSMLGAWLGGKVSALFPETLLLLLFAALMAMSAIGMWRPSKPVSTQTPLNTSTSPWPILLQGLGVGVLTGFVGAGGGFLIVPALVLLRGLSMRAAVGTSALITATNSLSGALGHLSHTPIQWSLALPILGAMMLGAIAGVLLSSRLPQTPLKRAFGALALGMSIYLAISALT